MVSWKQREKPSKEGQLLPIGRDEDRSEAHWKIKVIDDLNRSYSGLMEMQT